MKKIIVFIVIFITTSIIKFSNLNAITNNQELELRTSEAILKIDRLGNIRISHEKERMFEINSSIKRILTVVSVNSTTRDESEYISVNNFTIKKCDDIIKIKVSDIINENKILPIEAELNISVKNDAFCFSGLLKRNVNEDCLIKKMIYPILSITQFRDNDTKVYWPNGMGQCFSDLSTFGIKSFDYPSVEGTMAWFSINSSVGGLYVGSHDPTLSAKTFQLEYDIIDKSFVNKIQFPVNSNEFIIPDIIIRPYKGSWHLASKFYRNWYDNNFEIAKVSEWARKCEGYLLCILKQQNGDVMFNFKDIDKLCDIAERLNFRLIGLWGRGIGGHDRLYPNYMPDNLLGGREEMRRAIARANERGFKIIVYTNGKIVDTSTDYYKYNGLETVILDEKKQPLLEFWRKHKNTTPLIFATACPGSSFWRKTMLDLALDAKSLGANAFYIDQVGQGSPVTLQCYSDNHDHQTPQEAYSIYRIKLIQDIRKKIKQIDPDFSVMTEGLNDALLNEVDFFQGVPNLNTPFLFPEMFRYTFPEVISVTVNPSPALDRFDANYSSVYGLRHQIMSRYPADADYLLNGIIPEDANYSNVVDPPNLKKLAKASPEEMMKYTHSLLKFENDNSDFFRFGRFIDVDGINVKGDCILAKGYINGNKMGVVVWNQNLAEKRSFSISVPGFKFIKATEPNNSMVSISSPLDANSIRLLIYEKNEK